MSNPTELPDLDAMKKVISKALGTTHIEDGTVAAFDQVVDELARAVISAQPEGEAPQAEPVAYITSDKRMLVFADRVNGNDQGMTPLYTAATLSPLCGAQHAESGKERGSIEDYNEFNRLLDLYCDSQANNYAALVAYIDKWADRRAAQLDGGQEGSESNG